jgi:hypothetical protein
MATPTQQFKILRSMVLGVSVFVIDSQRYVPRYRMNTTPITLLALRTGPLKQPPANMPRNTSLAAASVNLTGQPA